MHSILIDGLKPEVVTGNDNTYFFLKFQRPLAAGSTTEILFDFSVDYTLDNTLDNNRPEPRNSRLFGYYEDVLMLDYFYPSIVVENDFGPALQPALPYGDLVFNDAALISVTLTHPADFIFGSTGKVVNAIDSADDLVQSSIVCGPVRSFFLAGSRNWERYTVHAADPEKPVIHAFGPVSAADALLQGAQFLAYGLDFYSDLLVPYPYTELDLVWVPAGWSAMEFSGVIGIGENFMSKQTVPGSAANFRNYETIVIHELLHQWFFSYVGNDQLNEPWLDEGFVQALELWYYSELYGRTGDAQYMKFLQSVRELAGSSQSGIARSVYSFENSREYTAVVYGEAAFFFMELAELAGKERFLGFVRWYLQQNRWSLISGTDFRDQLNYYFKQEFNIHFEQSY